jgi:sugar phosphate isomerase/epimerase
MIRSSVTISLVPEAKGGPFVFQNGLEEGLAKAVSHGFDAVELFLPSAEAVSPSELRHKLGEKNLRLSALGTGGGFLKHRWNLCSPDRSVRGQARDFISKMMVLGSDFQASVIIGSMKGSVSREEDRGVVADRLVRQLHKLVEKAVQLDTQILLEPLNRYETNLVNTLEEGATIIEQVGSSRLRLLADLFHMNIEEESIWRAFRRTGPQLGYVHFVDSNRRAAGLGHLDFSEFQSVLSEIGYEGFLSAEALPYPDPDGAARQTIESYQRFIQPINQEKSL